ncbi:hypothetical protein D3C72_1936470 [compost metagenome]
MPRSCHWLSVGLAPAALGSLAQWLQRGHYAGWPAVYRGRFAFPKILLCDGLLNGALARVAVGLQGDAIYRLSRSCLGRKKRETLGFKPQVPALQGVALEGFGVGVDVGGLQVGNVVVQQQLTDEVIHAQVEPEGASDLAQVVTGPFPTRD